MRTQLVTAALVAGTILALQPHGRSASGPDARTFTGLWEGVDNNDGARRTFSIADRDGDGVYEVSIRDTFWTLCGGDRGLHRGTGVVSADRRSMLVSGPLVCFETGQELLVEVLLEYSRETDTLEETPLGTSLVSNTLHRVGD